MPRPSRPAARGRAVLGLHHLEDRTTPVSFGPVTGYVLDGSNGDSVAIGDLNGDGFADIAAAAISDGVTPLINDGTGQFTVSTNVVPLEDYLSIALADVDADGKLDLIASRGFNNDVAVARGNGDGTFAAATFRALPDYGQDLAVADLTGDGRPDAAAVHDQGLSVLVNNGSADVSTWTRTDYASTGGYVTVVAADFDDDGFVDLAAGGGTSTMDFGWIDIQFNDGLGTFGSPTRLSVPDPAPVRSLAAGDLTNDGRADLVATYFDDEKLLVILAAPGRTFTTPTAVVPQAGNFAGLPFVADLDVDGFADVVVPGNDNTTVLTGDGTGLLTPAATVGLEITENVIAGDLTSDGKPDLVSVDELSSSAVGVALNTTPPLKVTAVPSAVAGQGFDVTVTARLTAGGTGYTGTIRFGSDDPRVSPGDGLPADYTFVAGDNGTKTFTGVTLETAGLRTLTVTDTARPAEPESAQINVVPAVATRFDITGPGATTAGVSQTYTVTAYDVFDNVATNYTGTLRVTSTDGQALLPPTFTLIGGARQFNVELRTAGSRAITLTDTLASALTGTRSGITVSPAAADEIVPVAGNAQTSIINAVFTDPLRVRVEDAFGNGVPGVAVTFAGPGAGAGVTFPDGDTATTDANGEAAVRVQANGIAGGYAVSASAAGLADATFNLGNTARTIAGLVVVSGAGQGVEVGDPFADPLVVRVVDNAGDPVAGAVVTFTGPAGGAGAVLPNGGVVTADGSGLASITPTANTVSGAYTITAVVTGGGVTATAGLGATNTPGPAVGVELVAGGGQEIAVGTPFEQPIGVRVVDQFGNGIPNVTVSFTANPAANGATATFPDGPVAVTDADGVTAFLADANTVAGSYSLTAAVAGLGTVQVPLTNLPGAVAGVQAVGGGGQTRTVNAPFANALRAKVVDSFGNGVPGVSVRFASPVLPAAGAVFENGDVVTTGPDGVAVAPIRANVAAGSYTVTAAVDGVTTGASFALTNTPGAAAVVQVVAGDGRTTRVGTPFGTPPAPPVVVKVTDAFGNGVPDVVVTFTAPGTGASAVFAGGTNTTTATTGADGTAGVAVTANTVAGSYTVTASAAGAVAAGSVGLTNTAGAAAVVEYVSGDAQAAVANTPFAAPLVVRVRDSFGNPAPGVVVRFAGPLDLAVAGVAFLSGPATEITTNAQGLAEANPGANTHAGEYDVTATVVGVAAGVTFGLANTPGAAFAAEAASGAGQTTGVGSDFGNPLIVRVTDRFGNGVPGVVVTFAESPAGAPGVTFPGGRTATTGSDGRAGVAVRANNASGEFAVTATAAGIASPVAFLLKSTPGAAVGVAAVGGGGQTVRVGSAFPDPLVVAAVDQFGNRVPGVEVRLADAGRATFAGPTTRTTGPGGTASFPAAAGPVAGPHTVVFVADSLPGSEARFDLTNAAGDVRALELVSGGGQSAAAGEAFAAPLVVRAVDQFGNAVSGVVVGFTVPAGGATATFPGGVSVTTGPDGTVNVPVTAGTVSGAYTVGITAPLAGGVGGLTTTLTNAAGPAVSVTAVGGNNQRAETNAAYARPLVALVTDRFGNPVPGATVSFVGYFDLAVFPPPPEGPRVSVVPGSQPTGADGRASFAATANGVAGAVEARFAVAGTGGPAVFALTNTPPPTGLLGSEAVAVGTGPGVPAQVRLLDANGTETGRFDPFPGFTGGVRTAAADFNGDGIADVAAGAGPGGNRVRVYDGKSGAELFSVQPFEAGYAGGVFVAAGDLDGDGAAELVITPDQGGGPRVTVLAGRDFRKLADFLGIDDAAFRGGARAALGDFNRDGKADLVVAAGAGGGPRLAAYDGVSVAGGQPAKLFNDIFVFEQRLRDGVYVAVGDVDGDGVGDLVAGGGPGGGPRVLVLSGADLLGGNGPPRFVANFFAGSQEDRGGVRVAVKDLDGDARADLVAGAANRVIGYLGKTVSSTGAPPEEFGLDATLGVFVG